MRPFTAIHASRIILVVLLLTAPLIARAESFLLMAEEEGCVWCAKWHAEIGPIYPKTEEARIAPLQRTDIDSPPADVLFAKPLHYTPTFVYVVNGAEVGRIEGYPGEDFFWGLLQMVMNQDVNSDGEPS